MKKCNLVAVSIIFCTQLLCSQELHDKNKDDQYQIQSERDGKICEINQKEPIFIQYQMIQDQYPLNFDKSKIADLEIIKRKTYSYIKNKENKIILEESSYIEEGLIKKQILDQLQIKERYVLTVEGDDVIFKTYKILDDKNYKFIEEKKQKINENFSTGPSMEVVLKKNRKKLFDSGKVYLNFGVFELLKSFEFKVKKEKFIFDEKLLSYRMSVNSLFLSIFADPLHIELDPETFMLKRYRGRTPVRIERDQKWVPFDADIYYELKK